MLKKYLSNIGLVVAAALVLALAFPILSAAQTNDNGEQTNNDSGGSQGAGAVQSGLSQDGIFNCKTGRYTMDVGSLAATGGAYVPVNDAAVTLNTGYLIYKECVLDPMTGKIREGITSGIVRITVNGFLQGDNGSPQFVRDWTNYQWKNADQAALDALQNGTKRLATPYQRSVQAKAASSYMQSRNDPAASLAPTLRCSDDDIALLIKNDADALKRCGGVNALYKLALDPTNNPLGADLAFESYMNVRVAAEVDKGNAYAMQGGGVLPSFQTVNGVKQVTTPGVVVAGLLQQVLGSGYRQLESANEIDQIVGALFSSLSSQILTDQRGLIGLAQATPSNPSYLDRVVAQSGAEVRNNAVNTALSILSTARNVENQYLQAENSLADTLNNAISQFRASENTCWQNLVPAVQSYATTNGIDIKTATSTAFSSAVINGQIAPLATSTVAAIRQSQNTISVINGLIQDVMNTTSAAVQSIALQRLDALIAAKALHSALDLQNILKATQDTQNSVTALVQDTVNAWGGNGSTNSPWDGTISPGVGWCNYTNQSTLATWANLWKK